jgi:hypothetical protein
MKRAVDLETSAVHKQKVNGSLKQIEYEIK